MRNACINCQFCVVTIYLHTDFLNSPNEKNTITVFTRFEGERAGFKRSPSPHCISLTEVGRIPSGGCKLSNKFDYWKVYKFAAPIASG